MRKFLITLIVFIVANTLCDAKQLFTIGRQDHLSREFKLAPADYKSYLMHFSGEKGVYNVGYSTPSQHWPYVLPGPRDSWAGGGYWAGWHPRHFSSIYFNLDKTSPKDSSIFSIFFLGAKSGSENTLRVEINGHRIERTFTGDGTDDLLTKGQSEEATPIKVNFPFPSGWLVKGVNRIKIGSVAGSWAVYDCLVLETPEQFELRSAHSTLVKSVKAASFEYEQSGKRFEPLLVDIIQSDESKKMTFEIDGQILLSQMVEPGNSIIEVYMPAVTKSRKSKYRIFCEDKLLDEGTILRQRQPLHHYSDYVDLLMGTGNSRWMFKPVSTLPLSMVQIAPDNQDETWKAGYEYTIENIMGFNHFSDWTMTGFIMQPTCGSLQVNPGREQYPDEGYRARIDKSSEKARVGHYSVYMTDTDITAEITSTRRAAMQRYTFPENDQSRVMIDMFAPNEYLHNLIDTRITKINDREIEGYATYHSSVTGYSLVQEYTLYFVLQFSKPFDSMGGWVNDSVPQFRSYVSGWNRSHQFEQKETIYNQIESLTGKGDAGVFVHFKTKKGEQILVRSGVSLVDMVGARNNLKSEISDVFGWDFNAIVANSQKIWDEYLSRIKIETNDYLQKCKFYTNLFRALGAKAIWSDADGRFVDEEERICQLSGKNDVIVSGEYWNTFWNNQLLFNLIAPEISSAWANSAINLYKNSGWFNTDPAGVEHTGVMVAMHVVSQIQGAWQSGIRDFDIETAYQGLKKMLTMKPQRHPGGGTVGVEHLEPYMKNGYVPSGKGYVSNTLEYAYDDWALAQMAKVVGQEADYDYFMKRSESWRNIFDTVSGFIRPKNERNEWIEPFDPYRTPGFVEGNAFNYTWFVPQNPEGLIKAMGRDRFVDRLNEAMEKSAKANFNAAGDNFTDFPINHGNQTSMEVTALFNWAGAPWLTQKWVRAIQEQYYGNTPYDAYPGDEDLGQMSSWFIMSTLGLFQLDGGCSDNPAYELTSPRYPKITLNLGGKYGRGKEFIIEARNASKENRYIQRVELNGKTINTFRIPQSELLRGGNMVIEMGAEPNKGWGVR